MMYDPTNWIARVKNAYWDYRMRRRDAKRRTVEREMRRIGIPTRTAFFSWSDVGDRIMRVEVDGIIFAVNAVEHGGRRYAEISLLLRCKECGVEQETPPISSKAELGEYMEYPSPCKVCNNGA